jgi:hypothetical protein
MKIKTDFIISINVHEKPEFLLKQIDNIKNYVCDYYIILNCNQFMYDNLKNITLPYNVIVNSEIIEKARFHGSLTKGIYSNMIYADKTFDFLYFIVLSSRNLFYNKLNIDFLNLKQSICYNINKFYENEYTKQLQYDTWHWPSFLNTELAKYYISKNLNLQSSPHEGLVLHCNVIYNIINFLEKNIIIKNDLFNFTNCVEEFSLQTIATNEINPNNNYNGYIYIGHGIDTQFNIPSDPNLFVYKTTR